jgi:hypothetical protein
MCEFSWFSNHYEFFKDFTGPTVTLVAAVAALRVSSKLGKGQLSVGQQQAELADIRFKHDVFDRRFEVYEATRNFLIAIIQAGTVSNEQLGEYVRGKEKVVFLFDQATVDYLDDLYKKANRLQAMTSQLDHRALPVGPERTELSARRGSCLLGLPSSMMF